MYVNRNIDVRSRNHCCSGSAVNTHTHTHTHTILYLYIYLYRVKMCILISSTVLSEVADRGSTVVKMLCYKSEGRWFDPSWCQWIFR